MATPTNPLGSTGPGVLHQLQQLLQNSQAQQAPVSQAQDQFQQQGQSQLGQQMSAAQPATPQGLPQQGPAPQADYSGGMGGRIKNTLSNFFYGMGQGMLKEAGLPTDYQKQQQALVNNQKQQQLDQSKQEIGSLIQLHQGQLQQEQFDQQPINLPAPIAQMTGMSSVARKDFPAAISAYGAIANNSPTMTAPAGLEHLGFTAGMPVSPHQVLNATKMNALLTGGAIPYAMNGQQGLLNKATGQFTVLGPDEKVILAHIAGDAGIQRMMALSNSRIVQVVDPNNPENVLYSTAGTAQNQGLSAPSSIPFQTSKATTKAFTSGAPANTLNAYNTAISHLQQLSGAADALGNGDTQLINRFSQEFARQTGETAPTNFEAIRDAVAGEISKTFKGGQATDKEIAMMNSAISNAQSPQQLKGVIDTYSRLMGSKREALQNQYQSGKKGQPNFGNTPQQPAGQTGGYNWEQFPVRKTGP